MILGRVKAMAVKEALQIWRDPRSLMIALLMPLLQMAMLGYGVSLDIKHVPLCAVDQEGSQQSQALMKRFQASPYFSIAAVLADQAAVPRALDHGVCRMAVVVPADFSRRLNDARASSVQVILDATDDNTASVATGYAQSVVADFASELQLRALARQGRTPEGLEPLAVQSRVWFNEDLDSHDFIIPGVVALVMALVGAQLSSLTISREWERGTMELLISTPVTRMEIMVGKLLPYFAVGMVDAALCLSIAVFWFTVPFRGTVATLLATTSLFLVVILCIGYLVSVAVRRQVAASQIALVLTMLPTTLLSGFAFPIDQMPLPVQAVTYLVYSRYYITILKAIFLKGAGVVALAWPIAMLLIYAAVIAFFAARAFRKSLD